MILFYFFNNIWRILVTIRFCKILIVDDTQLFREKIKRTLHDAKVGYKYYFAKDGKEAISQYIAHRPHVTIMDIIMPNLDGVKASEAIMKFDPNAKIIIISTKDNQETINAVIKNRSEEHTSELQSQAYLVCRLLLEKKKNQYLIKYRS